METKINVALSILLLLASGVTVVLAGQHRVVQVVPDVHQPYYDGYQENCTVSECYTFFEFVRNVEGSNIMVAFLPGIHIANHDDFVHVMLFFTGIYYYTHATNVTLTAANCSVGATIACNGTFGFAFINVTNLQVSGLTFENCGVVLEVFRPHQPTFYFTLYVARSRNINITDVTVTHGKGYGLHVKETHGFVLLSGTKFLFNEHNFYFSTDAIEAFTNLTVSDSMFLHGTAGGRGEPGCAGVCLHLLHTEINVTVSLINIHAADNDKCNVLIQYNVCRTKLDVSGMTSLNADSGLVLVTKTTLNKCPELNEWTRVTLDTAVLMNTSLLLTNGEMDFSTPLRTGIKYVIILSDVSVSLSEQRNEFRNVHGIILNDVTFENTGGVSIENVTMLIEGNFHYIRNRFALAIFTSFDNSETGATVVLDRSSTVTFRDNTVLSGFQSPLHVTGSTIRMEDNTHMVFHNNTGLICGGMHLVKANVILLPYTTSLLFSHNTGSTGGAMAFYDGSQLHFYCTYAKVQFIDNRATDVGGAIYIQDSGYFQRQYYFQAFFTVFRLCQPFVLYPEFDFENNTAQFAGSALYGGWIDYLPYNFAFVSKVLSHLLNDQENPSLVSSDPTRVCLCVQSTPNCSTNETSTSLFPGQTYSLEVVAVGQRFGTVPSIIRAQFISINGSESTGELDDVQQTQDVGLRCSLLTFTVRSLAKRETLTLTNSMKDHQAVALRDHISGFTQKSLFDTFYMHFSLKGCPLGFYFNYVNKQCSCQKGVIDSKIMCDLNTFQILRPTPKWINATFLHLTGNQFSGVIVHNHCPFDYCQLTEAELLPLDLETPDDQCAFNRSGILCGACQTNFSHVLGTSRCKRCPKPWIALILPSMALAGIVLVAFLIILNLTVSTGSISGLIFYANIVKVNSAVFFPPGVRETSLSSLSSFLSTFIAWMNLDLGIEACFYDGLTAYAKTWFQFLFPLYIWCLVILIIIASHYSSTASRLSGNNAVQVLATLFLLSYAKLLRLIITIFSSTELVYPDGYIRKVWLYDGNVDYLKGKHIPLFVAALFLLVFVSAPYTAVLLLIQWLQKWSFLSVFFWVRKLHPLFDAYTGPYKVKHRYWTGLLLLVRVCLFLVFSLNSLGDPTINFLAVVAMTFCLLTYVSFTGGIYKLWFLNVLENAFILNLGLLSAAVGFYQNNTSTVVPAITCTSVGISFLLFVVIIFVHLVLKIVRSRQGRDLMDSVKWKRFKPQGDQQVELAEDGVEMSALEPTVVTHTVVEVSLNEPLLKANEQDGTGDQQCDQISS